MKNLLARAVETSEPIGALVRSTVAEALRELAETGHLHGGVEEAEAVAAEIGEHARLKVLSRYTDIARVCQKGNDRRQAPAV